MQKQFSSPEKSIGIYALAGKVRQKMKELGSSDDEAVKKLCDEIVFSEPQLCLVSPEYALSVSRLVYSALRCELEILQDLADNPLVTEIMVNGKDSIFVEYNGHIQKTDLNFDSSADLERVISRLAARVGREMNDMNPIVDARLSDGSRINAVASNIAIGGPVLTIRKFTERKMDMEGMVLKGDITKEAADFLKKIIIAGYNCFVSGGTSSGKTTMLNILSEYIPPEERIIVIEDSAELSIKSHDNLVRMEAKKANAQGRGGVSIRDLIKASLRMRPDRIIVGEVRGDEVVDMLAAMSTGHDGSLSTGHANSPAGMLGRLETLHIAASGFPISAVRKQIAGAIEIIVHMQRFPGGSRKVTEIDEITGIENDEIVLNKLFVFDKKKGLVPTGNELKNTGKLEFSELQML